MKTITLNDIAIRTRLHPGDLGYVAYLHGDLYTKENGYGLSFESYVLSGLGEFSYGYNPEADRIWMCEHDGKMIGFLLAQHRPAAIQLRYFIFRPEYRGIGLGKKLMTEFIGFMKQRGVKDAYLWTTDEQLAAISLYTRFGFKLTEERHSHSFGKPLTERRYDLHLA
ncbi:GNAT family N-acetyltransferase [Niastella koreensis]|uniref:GCN5-related N-acetyltransferase n=2 Tax=Niastella koreensis TaxID=354356 RepID=G8TAB2_NIAKG|nr:GNAT family N-acetyltransferase [Niastella koreensis]AEV97059.1 GCN5-related N-acetyltransferase [Niastella koreensis GR20-10]OQP39251.1 GNAT family N-acetyltransferase [Niastella koreensis]